jgi:hypothetical protein
MKTKSIFIAASTLMTMLLASCQSSISSLSEEISSEIESSEMTSEVVSSIIVSSEEPASEEISSEEISSEEVSSEEVSSEEISSEVPLPDVPDLFISEYIEGPNTNKILELYNPTNTTIDLSSYTIKTFYNGDEVDSEEAE